MNNYKEELKLKAAETAESAGQSSFFADFAADGKEDLLRINDLSIIYKSESGVVKAVNKLNLRLGYGETLGFVGETGAGKTTSALGIMRLVPNPPGEITEGEIHFEDENLREKPLIEMRAIRGSKISMIFQDPMTSLNPVMTVGEQIEEVIQLHTPGIKKRELRQKAEEMLETVGIRKERINEYPHKFSGGMKQRVVIAMALACNPALIIADEPTTALDVTIQAQVLQLMRNLKDQYNTSMIMITHDLGVVAEICDYVAIMYAGSVIEYAKAEKLYADPQHPYTKSLFASIPKLDEDSEELHVIPGSPPDPTDIPKGCPFRTRCEYAFQACESDFPPYIKTEDWHYVACRLYSESAEGEAPKDIAKRIAQLKAFGAQKRKEAAEDTERAEASKQRKAAALKAMAASPPARPIPKITTKDVDASKDARPIERTSGRAGSPKSSPTLLEVRNLKKYFKTKYGMLHAVDDINFKVAEGETLGLVGESGCGKSTCGRAILRLHEPTAGEVYFEGKNILDITSRKGIKAMRNDMQIVFQDPYSSLNPRMNTFGLIADPLLVNKICDKGADLRKRVREVMDIVGLEERLLSSYPHEMDGGRRQRVGIARALVLEPKFIVMDEPVSALDVSIQAQILNLMNKLQKELALTYLFISHNLSVVKHVSDRVAVMYLGKIVEITDYQSIFDNPRHPYTQALLSAIPLPKCGVKRERIILEGDVPSPIEPKPGCRFASRCPYKMPECELSHPDLKDVGGGHEVACFLNNGKGRPLQQNIL